MQATSAPLVCMVTNAKCTDQGIKDENAISQRNSFLVYRWNLLLGFIPQFHFSGKKFRTAYDLRYHYSKHARAALLNRFPSSEKHWFVICFIAGWEQTGPTSWTKQTVVPNATSYSKARTNLHSTSEPSTKKLTRSWSPKESQFPKMWKLRGSICLGLHLELSPHPKLRQNLKMHRNLHQEMHLMVHMNTLLDSTDMIPEDLTKKCHGIVTTKDVKTCTVQTLVIGDILTIDHTKL